jgi:phosphoribosyl 1,2-cyclic phosphate phosphodiesterase
VRQATGQGVLVAAKDTKIIAVDALILGSGGSQPTPKALCTCRVCSRARQLGGRDRRSGPSLYLPQAQLLIDTPEEANDQLNRHGILGLEAVLWSHFHPDHTAGVRIVEYISRWGMPGVPTFLPEDLEASLDGVSLFAFAKQMNHITIHRVLDRVPFMLGELSITLLRHRGRMPMYSFLIEHQGARLLYSPDHFSSLALDAGVQDIDLRDVDLRDVDVAIVQVGLLPDGTQPFILPTDHPARKALMPIDTVLTQAKANAWRSVVFTHLYEAIRLFPEEYDALAEQFTAKYDIPVRFAEDGMRLRVGSGTNKPEPH